MNTQHLAASPERQFPPIAEISVSVMGLLIIGGIYIASHLPKAVSLTPAYILVGAALILLLANIALLNHLKEFAWKSFWQVAKWSLLAYSIIAGMLEFIFIYDGTRGKVLALFSTVLAIFAINIPVLFGFSVARYQEE